MGHVEYSSHEQKHHVGVVWLKTGRGAMLKVAGFSERLKLR